MHVLMLTCAPDVELQSMSVRPGRLLQSTQIPNRRWAQVMMNFITGLPPTKQQHDATLTLMDTMSEVAHFFPAETTVTAEGVVSLLADRLVRYHGLPSVLVSDGDPRFGVVGAFLQEIPNQARIVQHLASINRWRDREGPQNIRSKYYAHTSRPMSRYGKISYQQRNWHIIASCTIAQDAPLLKCCLARTRCPLEI